MLDARSKSERGDALAQLAHDLAAAPGEADDAARATRDQQAVAGFWAPRNAGAVKLDESMTPMQAMAAVAAECVDHIARNAAVLAEVNTLGVYRAGTPEHVHQLRVGVRRLRSAWRLFDGWIADPSETLAQGARTHFSAFGMARDQDVLADTIMPLLARAGMPALPAEAAPSNDNAQSLAVDREARQQRRFDADLGLPVHAQRLAHPRHQEQQR
ncbi:CHAD domain protein, partial [Bordetella pertussis H934]